MIKPQKEQLLGVELTVKVNRGMSPMLRSLTKSNKHFLI